MISADLQIVHAGELVCIAPAANDTGPRRGPGLSELHIIKDGALAARDGVIVWIGATDRIGEEVEAALHTAVIDVSGRVVTPGLIDCHTHLVYPATRQMEFEMRAAGKTYMEIAAAGGGIKSSVKSTRAATLDQLIAMGMRSADHMLRNGTTTAEAKSGYGLNLKDEIKLLDAIATVNDRHALDLVATVLAAHEFPPEYADKHDDYVACIIEEILPEVAHRKLAEFSDIFFETGVYDRAQTERVQSRAKELGFGLKFHVDQLTDVGGAALSAAMGAVSADHLEFISDDGVAALANSETIAVFLPGATYFLGMSKYPPARAMIESGVAVAVATDCNPGSNMSESMPMAMNQACVMYKMTPAEALVASTLNAACAIHRADRVGALTVGRQCDLVAWDVSDYREIAYHYGVNLADMVVKNGKQVS